MLLIKRAAVEQCGIKNTVVRVILTSTILTIMQIAPMFIIYLEVNVRYRIIGQTDEIIYSEILKIAFEESDNFSICSFKRYHKKDLADSYFDFFNQIRMYEKDAYAFHTPNHYERGQKFHVFELNEYTKALIGIVKSFRGWMAPNYPEDLSFYRNKKVWLYCISHENLIFIETENDELIRKFLNLGIRFVKEQ